MYTTTARHHTVEVLINDAELSMLDQIRGGLGRSPFFRNLMHAAVSTHGKRPPAPKEPRSCRGMGRPASRAASVHMSQRRMV